MQRYLPSLALVCLALAVVVISGCGSSNDQLVYQNVSERGAYNADGTRLAFASFGGNGLLYVYSLSAAGTNLVLLNSTDNDTDLTDEGGSMPAWAPNGNDLCFVSRRGGGNQALFLMDPVQGDIVRLTKLTDDTTPGADSQPAWSADSQKLVFVSNKRAGGEAWDIVTINRDGTGRTDQNTDGAKNQWPVFSPDGTRVAFQSDKDGSTDIWVLDLTAGTSANLTGPNSFREEAPAWSPDGNTLLFHSNRAGDFDIWSMASDGTNSVRLTNDARSDGFPVWNNAGTRIAFTRARELWTMAANGTDQKQITRRF